MGGKKERHKLMLDMLQREGSIKPSILAERLGVSLVTVRRDLKELNSSGRVMTGYGVVKPSSSQSGVEQSFDKRLSVNIETKKKLAYKALEFINENDILFLGSGTTCYYLAELLIKNFSKLHIVTNGLRCLNLFASVGTFNVESVGGSLLHGFSSLIGPKAEAAVRKSLFSKCFLSCAAYRDEGGIFEISPFSASLKKIVVENTERSFIMIDSTKVNAVAHSFMAFPEEIDVIITDSMSVLPSNNRVIRVEP